MLPTMGKNQDVKKAESILQQMVCLLTLLESFDKNNPEMGIDSVARQRLQKTVQQLSKISSTTFEYSKLIY